MSIPAARELLRILDIPGGVITLGALHAQRETARVMTAHSTAYVHMIKYHRPTIPDDHRAMDWSALPSTTMAVIKGRIINRRCFVVGNPVWDGYLYGRRKASCIQRGAGIVKTESRDFGTPLSGRGTGLKPSKPRCAIAGIPTTRLVL